MTSGSTIMSNPDEKRRYLLSRPDGMAACNSQVKPVFPFFVSGAPAGAVVAVHSAERVRVARAMRIPVDPGGLCCARA